MSAFNKEKLLKDIEDIQAASIEFSRYASAIRDEFEDMPKDEEGTVEDCVELILGAFVLAERNNYDIAGAIVKELTELLEKEAA